MKILPNYIKLILINRALLILLKLVTSIFLMTYYRKQLGFSSCHYSYRVKILWYKLYSERMLFIFVFFLTFGLNMFKVYLLDKHYGHDL